MAQRNKKRDISGILLLNKDQGITSNKALQKAKTLFNASKAGHTGSLDPLATGMLPLCFGEATKFSQFLLDADKAYRAVARLGVKTDTADSLGTVIQQTTDFSVSAESMAAVLDRFRGTIQQVPSMYSALKHKGRPLYSYAREGMEIERAARTICIQKLDLLAFDGDSFTLDIICSKGTYVRNMVEDIGDALGVGAHLTALHRRYTAGFAQDAMIDLSQLDQITQPQRDALLKPADSAVWWMPCCCLDYRQSALLRQGQTIEHEKIEQDTLYRLYDNHAAFIGIGQGLADSQLKPHRLIAQREA